jgi:histidinol-phosphate aminotransferase
MSKYWSNFVTSLNENPYGPSPKVLQAMEASVNGELRLYPPPNADQLKQSIADYYQLNTDQVFVGNGSDEVLAHVFNALFRQTQDILFPDISYSFYPVYCGLYAIQYSKVPLAEDFSLDLDKYCRPNGGIIFPNPNAPTGRLLALSAIEKLLQSNRDSVVVVDEAYIDFADKGASAVALVNQYENLLVVQTMSKSRSLAGLRIGYAMGSAELIEGLERVKNSFNSYPLGHVQIAAGVAAFEDREYFEETRQLVINSRVQLTQQLESLGFEILPSAANFVFVRHPNFNAKTLAQSLREQNIIVRHFNKPRISEFLRITVGNQEQNHLLVKCLSAIIN